MEHRKETTGTSKPYDVGTSTDKRGDTMSGFEGGMKTGISGDIKDKSVMEGGIEGSSTGGGEGFWNVKNLKGYGSGVGGGNEMKLTAMTALKEAKNVLGNIMLRTLSGAEKSAAEKVACALKVLADWSSGSLDQSYKTFIHTSLKFDEAKHALRSLNMAHLDAQEAQFKAASKNMCEKQEILKRWVEKKKVYDTTQPKFLMKDREWIESISRFIEIGMSTCHSYHDAFDEAVRDYWFFTEKLHKTWERKREFKDMKDKMDMDTYLKYKKLMHECKIDTEKKMVNAKLDAEELRRRIVHFHHDCHDSTVEVLEFLRIRIPEYERLAKQHTDTPMISTVVENLRKKSFSVRDMLDQCDRKYREKVPRYEDKKFIDRLVETHVKGLESFTGGIEGGRGGIEGGRGFTEGKGLTEGKGYTEGGLRGTTGRTHETTGRTGDTSGTTHATTTIRVGGDK